MKINSVRLTVVFAGWVSFINTGIALEYDWNDYESLDVKGKTVLILDNDPRLLS